MSDNLLSWVLPTPSKFQINSKQMTEMLEQCLTSGKGPLYRHQIEAILNTRDLARKDKVKRLKQLRKGLEPDIEPMLIIAPTGSGKTGIISLIPYVLGSKRVLYLTPSKVISNQIACALGHWRDKKCFLEHIGMLTKDPALRRTQLDNLLEDVKLIQSPNDIHERPGNIVIVNAQRLGGQSKLSLINNDEKIIEDVEAFLQQFDTIIVDEAHHYPAKTWEMIIEAFKKPSPDQLNKKIVFVTATPYRMIGKKKVFILGEGIEARNRIAHKITPDDVLGIATRECKFWQPNRRATFANVFRDILKIFKRNERIEPRITPQAMVLVRTKDEANALADYMNSRLMYIDFAVAITADNPEALEQFTAGQYQVGITCGVAKEGYDNPDVVACVILRKIVHGRILFEQFVGRCMRLNKELPWNTDESIGIVLSYPEFKQRRLWEEMNVLAEYDPIDVDESDDEEMDFY